MRRIILALISSAGMLGAQQARSSTMVVHPHDPAWDAMVSLLGEDTRMNVANGHRLADANAAQCSTIDVPPSFSHATLSGLDAFSGSFAVPSGWHALAIPANPGPPPADRWFQRVGELELGSADRADMWARASISFTSQAGYPDVKLLKGSRELSESECRLNLGSGEPATLIEVTALSQDRGTVTYVVGYAQVKPGVWLDFLGSSGVSADAKVLSQVFRSLKITVK